MAQHSTTISLHIIFRLLPPRRYLRDTQANHHHHILPPSQAGLTEVEVEAEAEVERIASAIVLLGSKSRILPVHQLNTLAIQVYSNPSPLPAMAMLILVIPILIATPILSRKCRSCMVINILMGTDNPTNMAILLGLV